MRHSKTSPRAIVGLEGCRVDRAIAVLNLDDWVPRLRSFDVTGRWRIRLHVLARPRRGSVTVAPQFEQGDGPVELIRFLHPNVYHRDGLRRAAEYVHKSSVTDH